MLPYSSHRLAGPNTHRTVAVIRCSLGLAALPVVLQMKKWACRRVRPPARNCPAKKWWSWDLGPGQPATEPAWCEMVSHFGLDLHFPVD